MRLLTSIPESWCLSQALERYPDLRVLPAPTAEAMHVGGRLRVHVLHPTGVEIDATYELRIEIPSSFPVEAPRVFETGAKIASGFHTMSDRSLCLGSPLSIARAIRVEPTVAGVIQRLVAPYLYGHACAKLGLQLPFGELDHGAAGLAEELREELHVSDVGAVRVFLALAGRRRRVANQDRCYCGSRKLLRACHAHVVNGFRAEFGMPWIRRYALAVAPVRSVAAGTP